MIEGLHFDVPTEELRAMLSVREGEHMDKALKYDAQAAALRDAGAAQMSGMNPAESAKSCRARAAQLGFLKDHLVPNETYRLDKSDLSELGLLEHHW